MGWFETAWLTVAEHCRFYVQFAEDQWANLTPVKYTALLISIAVTGFLLMCREGKR